MNMKISMMLLLTIMVALITPVLVCRPAWAQFPFETKNQTDLSIVGTSVALIGAGFWFEGADGSSNKSSLPKTEEVLPFDPRTLNILDRTATDNWSPGAARLSDVFMYSSAVAPVSLTLSDLGSKQPLTLTAMHLETLMLNGGVTYLMKNLFRRSRPFVHNPDHRIPDSLRQSHTATRSFPSGHTSTSFSSMVFLASVFSSLYPDSDARAYVWGGCLAVASTTGYLRYRAGFHYPTDILAGAALGAFVGWLVPELHEIDKQDVGSASSSTPPMTVGFSIAF